MQKKNFLTELHFCVNLVPIRKLTFVHVILSATKNLALLKSRFFTEFTLNVAQGFRMTMGEGEADFRIGSQTT